MKKCWSKKQERVFNPYDIGIRNLKYNNLDIPKLAFFEAFSIFFVKIRYNDYCEIMLWLWIKLLFDEYFKKELISTLD